MDFFTHQERARRKTGLLMTYMTMAVLGITLSIYAVVRIFALQLTNDSNSLHQTAQPFFIPEIVGGVGLGVLLLVGLGALYKLASLRGGGQQVALSLAGQPLSAETLDPDERKILNIVEEMAIASGLPPPPVYIIPEDKSINAFAAGYKPETAVVGVTRGAIRALSRDELQGVMAHEFSHILNGDMRLNIRLIGLLHGILLIALLGTKMIRGGSHSRKDGAPIVVLGICFMIIGQVGVFFGHLIKSAVSRQREYLADASAVQFTRYPEGLAGALKKIGGLNKGSLIRHPRAEEASHMYFSNGLRRKAMSPLATHPPLEKRVSRLDPHFKGEFAALSAAELFAPPVDLAEQLKNAEETGDLMKGMPPIFKDLPIPGAAQPIILGTILAGEGTQAVLNSVGNPTPEHMAAARALLDRIPPRLRDAANSADGARALIFAQLLRYSQDQRAQMTAFLEKHLDENIYRLIADCEQDLTALPDGLYLPLAELCAQGLRELARTDYHQFKRRVQVLVELDKSVTLFEFALGNILFRTLDVHFDGDDRAPFKYYALRAVIPQASILLSAMAHLGQPDEEAARTAFDAAKKNGPEGSEDLTFLAPNESGLRDIQKSLDAMNVLAYPVRRHILQLCLNCLLQDGRINLQEAELFRAIAAALGCPVPVWLVPR